MSRQEKAIKGFMHRCLDIQKDEQTMDHILVELGKYYDADRSYIFEVNEEYSYASNTYEWCGEGVASKMGNQQNILLDGIKKWLEWFEEKGDFLLLSVAASVCYCEIFSRRREDAKLEQTEKDMMDRVNKGLADQKKLHETNENLTTLLAEEKQYTAIIGAMSNVYFGLYYIDLEKNTFQELISLDKIHHTLGEKGNAREVLRHMTNELAGDAYQPLMLKFTDFDTIDERLGDKPIIVQEYAERSGGWTQCSFIPVERDKNGKNRTVMCTLRSITAEKEVESQGNLIQALRFPMKISLQSMLIRVKLFIIPWVRP